MKGATFCAALESEVIDTRCVEPMDGRPKVLAVANVARNSLLTRQRHQARDKAVGLSRTVNRARQPHDGCVQAAVR